MIAPNAHRPADFATVELTAGQEIIVTCDSKAKFDGKTIPISLESWEGQSVDVNGHIFVGQYLFTGSESSSAYLTVQRVRLLLDLGLGVGLGFGLG